MNSIFQNHPRWPQIHFNSTAHSAHAHCMFTPVSFHGHPKSRITHVHFMFTLLNVHPASTPFSLIVNTTYLHFKFTRHSLNVQFISIIHLPNVQFTSTYHREHVHIMFSPRSVCTYVHSIFRFIPHLCYAISTFTSWQCDVDSRSTQSFPCLVVNMCSPWRSYEVNGKYT